MSRAGESGAFFFDFWSNFQIINKFYEHVGQRIIVAVLRLRDVQHAFALGMEMSGSVTAVCNARVGRTI